MVDIFLPITFIFISLTTIKLFAITQAQELDYFTNPIFPRNSADPAVAKVGNFYYLTLSENSEHDLVIFKSPNLTNFRNIESKVIFSTPEGYSDLWASELHLIYGQLYIYFTFQGGGYPHRMYVIQAENSTDPMGNWGQPIELMKEFEPSESRIDGTVLQHGNGQLYMAFSSMACLWIARMANTTYVDPSEFVLLRRPSAEWECRGMNGRLCMSEGPYFIYNNRGTSFLIFSASETFSPHYCLGMMSIDADKDPMNTTNWWYGPDGPVFYRNDEEDVYCTGHAAFTVSPDGTETWMSYHATDSPTIIHGNRIARVEKIDWDINGMPIFPRPHGFNHSMPVPSGQGKAFYM